MIISIVHEIKTESICNGVATAMAATAAPKVTILIGNNTHENKKQKKNLVVLRRFARLAHSV